VSAEGATHVTERFAAAINARDRDAWVACFHPDFEGYSGLAASETGEAYHGLEGAGAWFDNLHEVYESVQARLEQTLAVGDHALQLVRVEYLGRSSRVRLEAVLALVVELRAGRYRFLHSHLDLPDAFNEMARRMSGLPDGADRQEPA
jgi:ketosteroid isomerase-like protein